MKIFSDERLMALGIISGTVSRDTGTGRDIENVKKLFDKLNIDYKKILGLQQVHGTEMINIINDADLAAYKAVEKHEADGWLLGRADTGVLILTADCVPLYIWDDKGKFISLTHCGWRGVVGGLPAKAAAAVREHAGAGARLQAYIGPHISDCCFEVQEDVAGKFFETSVIRRDGKIFVDLNNEIILQLKMQGIKREDIKTGCRCECTCCNPLDFFSYRRDHSRDVIMSFAYKL